MRQEADAGLSPTLIAALGTIERHGPLTPSELADAERIKRPTATRSSAPLDAVGLSARAPDPSYGRASLLSIIPRGRDLLRRLRRRKNAYLSRRLRELESDDVDTVLDALDRHGEQAYLPL